MWRLATALTAIVLLRDVITRRKRKKRRESDVRHGRSFHRPYLLVVPIDDWSSQAPKELHLS